MSAAWVAGTVRGRALLQRRIGDVDTRELAALRGPGAASAYLATTSYQRFLPEGADQAAAERAVEDGVLWNLRVLAGWLPRAGTTALRVLAADFEIRNIEDKLRALSGRPTAAPFRLGALATAWHRASTAASAAELRQALVASAWGDIPADDPGEAAAGLRLRAAVRLAALHGVTQPWGAGSAALAVARRRFLLGGPLSADSAERIRPLVGAAALSAVDWTAYVNALPAGTAGWVLDGIEDPRRLWRAEERWWERVEQDARSLVRDAGFGLERALGCAVLLLADARSVRRALAAAVRDGDGSGGDDAHR